MADLKGRLSELADRLERDGCPHMGEVRAVFEAFGEEGGREPIVAAPADGSVRVIFAGGGTSLRFVVHGDGDLTAHAYGQDSEGRQVIRSAASAEFSWQPRTSSDLDRWSFHRTLRADMDDGRTPRLAEAALSASGTASWPRSRKFAACCHACLQGRVQGDARRGAGLRPEEVRGRLTSPWWPDSHGRVSVRRRRCRMRSSLRRWVVPQGGAGFRQRGLPARDEVDLSIWRSGDWPITWPIRRDSFISAIGCPGRRVGDGQADRQ